MPTFQHQTESRRHLSRAQIPPSPSPFNAGHAGYIPHKAPCKRTKHCWPTTPNIVDVTCCVSLHTLLHVVESCCAKFETGQTFSYV